MELCLLHANCQGEALAKLLLASPDFSTRWNLRHVVNYTQQAFQAEELAACSLFLYQKLGKKWGALASERVLPLLPAGAVALCLPNIFFKGYWPLWTSQSTMNFGDIYLDYLVDQGLEPREAVMLYLKKSLLTRYDPAALVSESLALEHRREAGALIRPVEYIEANWKQEQLLETVNHPGAKLMKMVADAVLESVGLPALQEKQTEGLELSCDPEFELPIHPVFAEYFGLPFASPERRYKVYGNMLTFAEYALAYADCRKHGINFFAYMGALRVKRSSR